VILTRLVIAGTVKTIFKYDGLRGFYRGLGPTILGYLPTWAIYFAVYDGIKTTFGEMPLGAVSETKERIYPAAQVKGYQPVAREHPWSLHILSAMAAGATSTACTNPLWVIKTRFMVRFFTAFIRYGLIAVIYGAYVRALLFLYRHSQERKSDIGIRLTLLSQYIAAKGSKHSIAGCSLVYWAFCTSRCNFLYMSS
jgi:hypothetical protein